MCLILPFAFYVLTIFFDKDVLTIRWRNDIWVANPNPENDIETTVRHMHVT
jgi:hypothetical protein